MFSKRNITIICLALSLAVFGAACKKKVPPPPPPPAGSAAAAAATAATAGACDCAIRGRAGFHSARPVFHAAVGSDGRYDEHFHQSGYRHGAEHGQPAGAAQRFHHLHADRHRTGRHRHSLGHCHRDRSAAAAAATAAAAKPTIEQRLESDVQDAYFDYDKSDIRADARDALTKDADALKSILADFPNATIMLEGNCDERGSAEYNLGLGDRRASSAKDFLVQLGVPADRLKTISYGKERPQCTESNESCWQKNRRVHFSPGQ